MIIATSLDRLFFHPRELSDLGVGLLVSFVASVFNLVVGLLLIMQGKKSKSIALEADGHHLLSDVWTSVAVIVGLILVILTGRTELDPIIAILVVFNILYTGFKLIKRSGLGLMDSSLSENELLMIQTIMNKFSKMGVTFHALKTRQAGARSFVNVHFLVPGQWTVHEAHEMAEVFEKEIIEQLGNAIVTTHIEPLEDEVSQKDTNEDKLE